MKMYLKGYETELQTFKLYLKTKYNLSDSTIEDYCKRIITICREEKYDIDYLNNNIEKIYYDYTEGNKKEQGARSHNSYKSALKKYYNYIQNAANPSSNTEIKYTVELTKHCKSIALVELKNDQGKVINADMLKKVENADFNKEIFKICYSLVIEELFDDSNIDKFNDFLKKLGVQISVDGVIL